MIRLRRTERGRPSGVLIPDDQIRSAPGSFSVRQSFRELITEVVYRLEIGVVIRVIVTHDDGIDLSRVKARVVKIPQEVESRIDHDSGTPPA